MGKASAVAHQIDTGQHAALYRLSPTWRYQLREEIHSLLDAGIIKPSLSPWSSSMVPVRKPDGSVRLHRL